MAFQSRGFALDLMTLPIRSDELGVVFAQGVGNNGRPLLLLFPQQGPGLMPHVRYAAYMSLRLGDGTQVSELGQLIVTGDRVVGVFIRGAAGGTRLDDTAGAVYAFSFDRGDLAPAELKTRRKGAVTHAILRSQAGLQPVFELQLSSVVGNLADSGQLQFGASLGELMQSFR